MLGVIGPDDQFLVLRTGDQISQPILPSLRNLIPKANPEKTMPATVMRNPWDGVRRYTVFLELTAFPLTIVAGMSEEEQLLEFQSTERTRYWQATLGSLLVITLGLLLWQLDRSRARIRKAQETYHAASEASLDATYILHSVCDTSGAVIDFLLADVNRRGLALTGLRKETLWGRSLRTLLHDNGHDPVFSVLSSVFNTGTTYENQWHNKTATIHSQWLHAQILKAADGLVIIVRDVSERKIFEAELVQRNAELTALNTQLTDAHEQLVQSEKLASIGLLAAGVAHEINNPLGFILSNFGTLGGYLKTLFEMLDAYKDTETALRDPALTTQIQAMRKQSELDFLREDIPALMSETKDGMERVRRIVQDLKNFSHVDSAQEWQLMDLHTGINSTLNVVNNEIKYKADVIKDYGDIPAIEGLPSEINQVVMNLLVNAAQAIGDVRGTITIRTGQEANDVWFEVTDSGCGISPEHIARIFDPFFTTKPVGKGTGLGLSLSYGIVKKHAGRLEVSSTPGVGTTFRVTLPKTQATQTAQAISAD
ncbi:MAG: ATP-binding protein [Pseudomonadota bacterium]